MKDCLHETHAIIDQRFGKQFGDGKTSSIELILKYSKEIQNNYLDTKAMLGDIFCNLKALEDLTAAMEERSTPVVAKAEKSRSGRMLDVPLPAQGTPKEQKRRSKSAADVLRSKIKTPKKHKTDQKAHAKKEKLAAKVEKRYKSTGYINRKTNKLKGDENHAPNIYLAPREDTSGRSDYDDYCAEHKKRDRARAKSAGHIYRQDRNTRQLLQKLQAKNRSERVEKELRRLHGQAYREMAAGEPQHGYEMQNHQEYNIIEEREHGSDTSLSQFLQDSSQSN